MSEKPLWWTDVETAVHDAAHGFSIQLCRKLLKQCENPKNMLARKNPFLYRIRGVDTASKYTSMCVDAFVSSSEETMFGAVFERCAEVIAMHGRGAKKSGIEGIDLEWDDNGIRVLAQIKSSVNWGNSSQKKQLKSNFGRATKILKQGTSVHVRCLECCSYGKSSRKVYSTHERIVGAPFWQEISMWDNVYPALIEEIGKHSMNGMDECKNTAVSRLVQFFNDEGMVTDGYINWKKFLAQIHDSPYKNSLFNT